MSWDVIFSSPNGTMGNKESAREKFLLACEIITGKKIVRNGPTEVEIDPSFQFEVQFHGSKHLIESVELCFKVENGDPNNDKSHPVLKFIHELCRQTGWNAEDSHDGTVITIPQ